MPNAWSSVSSAFVLLFWLINCIWPLKISILRDAIVFSNTTCLINWSTDRSKLNSGSQFDVMWLLAYWLLTELKGQCPYLLLRIGKCPCCPQGPGIACDPQDGPSYGRIVTTTQMEMVQHMGKKEKSKLKAGVMSPFINHAFLSC